MTQEHEILPLEGMQTTTNSAARDASGVDIEVDVASEPLVASGAGLEPAFVVAGSAQAADQALKRWRQIQGNFVDDPRGALLEARTLVDDLMQRIVRDFTQHRESLERQWASEQTTSTEQLRVCLQHYRAFFTRILPALPAVAEAEHQLHR